MKYAAIIKAQEGWKCALFNSENVLFHKEIYEWGMIYHKNNPPIMHPLDYLGKNISELTNFICIIDPNEETSTELQTWINTFKK